MATVLLTNINKIYDSGVQAVFDANVHVQDGEFLTIVGPSGCGKTSVLRMIAGLESVTSGELHIGELLANDVDPKDRDLAMVFQNFPLYPNLSVYENMAFGLKNRNAPKEVVDERVHAAAEMLGIKPYLNSKPKALTGVEKQRVTLARAIVREPNAVLFDDPLSNLDVKLKYTMRGELVKLHARMQTTFVYVTRDPAEAMSLGTRVMVMKDGFVQQVDTPQNLYDYPNNAFVADYIGGVTLLKNACLEQEGDGVYVRLNGGQKLLLPTSLCERISDLNAYLGTGKAIILGVHAEDVTLAPDGEISATVTEVKKAGEELLLACAWKDDALPLLVRVGEGTEVAVKDEVKLHVKGEYVQLFDGETELTLLARDEGYQQTGSEDSELRPLSVKAMQERIVAANQPAKGKKK